MDRRTQAIVVALAATSVIGAFALVQAQHVVYRALHLERFTLTEMLGVGLVLALAVIAAALAPRDRTGAR